MDYRVTFIGNESPYLDILRSLGKLELIVCDNPDVRTRKYFGSAFDYAKKHKIAMIPPEKYLNNPLATDLIVVSGYSRRIPGKIIRHPRIGIINIHQSLLPAYRGRHPLNWAIINQEKYTGVTIHHVNPDFDDGKIIFQKKLKIHQRDTVMDLHKKTVKAAKELLTKVFAVIEKKYFKGREQNSAHASYYPPRKPQDGKIDWSKPAREINNLIRALVIPYPGAFFYYRGKKIVIEQAEVINHKKPVSENLRFLFHKGSFMVKTKKGYLKILKTRGKIPGKIITGA